MAADAEDEFLQTYRDELSFLRRMGAKYAKSHPRIAKRLELTDGPVPDPHVERLLEGVAMLTARIQHSLEAELPEVTQGLLGYIYPHFTQPVPSMTIAQFEPDEGGAGVTEGIEIPKNTKLYVETSFQKRTCRFRNCLPVTIWPITVKEVRFENPAAYAFLAEGALSSVQSVLRVRLKKMSFPLKTYKLDKLRFYLNGERNVTGPLYELLSADVRGVVCLPDGEVPGRGFEPVMGRTRTVGFAKGEELLPSKPYAIRAYGLLQEYFAFPERFLFIDVENISMGEAKDELDLLFLLNHAPRRRINVSADSLLLGCTPIVNLFEKVSEPIYVKGSEYEVRVLGDSRWERTTEIHSIRSISTSLSDETEGRIEPLYGPLHSADAETIYWHMRRGPTLNPEIPGSDVWVSFVDASLRQQLPEAKALRAHTLCTNRDLATHLDQGDGLNIEDGPHALVKVLKRPSDQLSPPMQGEAMWRLISHLAMSHLSLPDGPHAVEALREQLRVYAFTATESIEPQLQAIEDVHREVVTLRASNDSFQGFCRVQRITIRIDEDRFSGISPVLLGEVLNQYFGLLSSVNVFTQLVLESKQREGTWKIWPPMIPTTDD